MERTPAAAEMERGRGGGEVGVREREKGSETIFDNAGVYTPSVSR